jgi:Protein of unknown function (DUF3429)
MPPSSPSAATFTAAPPSSTAFALGLCGLLPFVAGALAVWWLPAWSTPAAHGLASYAAVIVSFLGGIHWGQGIRHEDASALRWAVVPSLLAWAALLLPQLAWSLGALGICLLVCWAVDRRRYADAGWAAWLPLRSVLTAVAAASCFIGAAGAA